MPDELTKSRFLAGLHCVKRLYLAVRSPELAQQPGESDKFRMEQGRRLGESARGLFPGGILVESGPGDPEAAIAETHRAVASGAPSVYEAAFRSDGRFVRCDVIRRAEDGWDLIEVKSSGKVKDEHVTDLAFQLLVVEASGLTVKRLFVAHLDTGRETFEPNQDSPGLFKLTEVTEDVRSELPAVSDQAAALLRVLDSAVPPDERTNTHCANPPCPFYAHCHADQPEDDLVFLPGIRRTSVVRFREEGVETIRQIPFGSKLTPAQERARQVVVEGSPYLGAGLGDALAQITFPAHFVDFETAAPAVPLHPGMAPYESFPFQWSDQVLAGTDLPPLERSYLHDGHGDPREEFVRSLSESVLGASTIVFYSPYELTTLRSLARAGVSGAAELAALFSHRGVDLLDVIKGHVYFERFRGSFSIKSVLPAVVPELTYDGLEIKSGDTAALRYLALASHATTDTVRDQTRQALLEYCRLDTLAMVRLYQRLAEIAP